MRGCKNECDCRLRAMIFCKRSRAYIRVAWFLFFFVLNPPSSFGGCPTSALRDSDTLFMFWGKGGGWIKVKHLKSNYKKTQTFLTQRLRDSRNWKDARVLTEAVFVGGLFQSTIAWGRNNSLGQTVLQYRTG